MFTPFDHDHQIDADELRNLVGGKGAGLVEMTRLGIPVPPGFTIPTTACRTHMTAGWTPELGDAVIGGLRQLEATLGRRLGDPSAPLLVSVRSGAAISMPGMMDTVLNVGMTEAVAEALAARSGDTDFAWDTYRRAVTSFAEVVLGADAEDLRRLGERTGGEDARSGAIAYARSVADAGHAVPADPIDQLIAAVDAVFSSWKSARAIAYREREGIDHAIGTAATVQAMVFGNMGERSGTGVAFSRNPSTGENRLMGDFLVSAQGEDVVAGTHRTMRLAELAPLWPDVWAELTTVADTLERHQRDMVDLEFTVEEGRLWLLQARRAKRSPAAVFRTAVDMANDPEFPLERTEAVERCADHLDDPPRLAADVDDAQDDVIATGLAASPGRAAGVISFDPDDAVEREQRGERVILVRRETSPADIHGMAASVGLVTTLGGMVSHAAVVARSWGLAAVVGCDDVDLSGDALVSEGRRFEAGTTVTVCGDSGRVLLGNRPSNAQPIPEVDTIRAWGRAAETDEVAAGTASSAPLTADDCLRTVVLKGMGSADGLSDPLGADEAAIADALAELAAAGLIAELNAGRYRPTPEGIARVAELFAAESAAGPLAAALLEGDFHGPNLALKEIVTTWQVRTIDGEQVPNDHEDADYDAAVVERLRSDVHGAIGPIIDRLAEPLPRLARYSQRLDTALARLSDGDARFMAHPLLDSYHTAWFELHEEMIRIAGRDRATEAAAGRA